MHNTFGANRVPVLMSLWTFFALLAQTLVGQAPPTISSFPYQPSDAQQASDFKVNYGTGPATGGSPWSNGTIASPRQGEGGTNVQAWANRPTANYLINTTTWLHSPIFNFSGQSGLVLEYKLWIRAQANQDGMKLQVSTNGGTLWSDVTGSSVAYNGNTNTSNLLASRFGGGNACWTGTGLGGATANTCWLNLNPWAGQSDVRFRWCFVSNGSTVNSGPVLDGFKVVHVTSTTAYASGFAMVPQGQTVLATITKTQGQAFAAGMTVFVEGFGVTGTVTQVIHANQCEVAFSAAPMADILSHVYYIRSSTGQDICRGTMDVFAPQQLIANREFGSLQEPPQGATVGATSVYLHNGEFRHDLPLVSIPGRMLPLGAGITYRSALEYLGALGRGWSASFDVRLVYLSDQITLYDGQGRIDTFTLAPGGASGVGPYTLAGFFVEFFRNDNGTPANELDDVFTLYGPQGSSVAFQASNQDTANRRLYRQTSVSDRFGNKIQFIYNALGQLEQMRGDLYDPLTPSRYVLDFEYGPHGRLNFLRDYADYTAQAGVIGSSYVGPREWEFVYNLSTADLLEIKLPQTERYFSETKGANFRTRVQFAYDASGNMLEVIDARQANEAAPLGWLSIHYDAQGRVDYQDIGRTSAGDTTHRTHIIYGGVDALGRWKVNVINAMSYRSEYRVQAQAGSAPLGTADYVRHYTGEWDAALSQTGAKLRANDPDYYESSFTYDSQFNTISVTRPSGSVTRFRFDITNSSQRSRGNLLRILQHPGTAGTAGLPADQVNGLLATFTYTNTAAFNLLASSVSPRAYELGAGYDIISNAPITVDQSAEFTTTYTYNPDGTLASVTSPSVSASISPDSLNLGQSLQTSFTYNSFGQLLTTTDQAGVVTRFTYGTAGHEKGYLHSTRHGDQTASPLITTFGYNSVGRLITTTDPRGYTFTSYVNQLDQTLRAETPPVTDHGNVVYFSTAAFDLNGNMESSGISNFDENGNPQTPAQITTTFAYNLLDMVTSITEPISIGLSRTTTFGYDRLFRPVETILPEDNRSATDFDELNRAIKSYFGFDGANVPKAGALIQGESYFDLNSNTVRSVDGRGNDSHAYFDAFDRLIKVEDRLATNPNYTELAYNRAGGVVSAKRFGRKRQFTAPATWSWSGPGQLLAHSETFYDNLGRAYLSRVLAQTRTGLGLSYSMDETRTNFQFGWSTSRVKFRSNGQVEQTLDDLSYLTTYSYDAYNRLASVTDDQFTASPDVNTNEYAYDANGNLVAQTARLFDQVEQSQRALTTQFFYDSLNRMTRELAPVLASGEQYERTWRYDSRGHLVKAVDRRGSVRRYEYDLLGRGTRAKLEDVVRRRVNPATGLVSPTTEHIVSRTLYDKNSNVIQSIDPTGNATSNRYDLAHRWLQTEFADAAIPGSGIGLKRSAGSSHTLNLVGGGPFYAPAAGNAYDGNSNLLNTIDPNGTVVTRTFDANDLPLTETANTSSVPTAFGMTGESGALLEFDGLYRLGYARSDDPSVSGGVATETSFAHNTLGETEIDFSRVYTGGSSQASFSGYTLSSFDELSRRHTRENGGRFTMTQWRFDRKRRPIDTRLWRGAGTGIYIDKGIIASYQYFGGGLLHRRRTQWHEADFTKPIISDFKRDNMLRLTQVRHVRDENANALPDAPDALMSSFAYAYDGNSMMKYEARWYEADNNGASATPDDLDVYFHDLDDKLSKVVYNAKGTNLSTLNLAGIESDNNVQHSDRVIYDRRASGTRQRVNWYRGPNNPPANLPDGTTNPDQTTLYATSDDPNADPDNPAGPGNGSRHNYTTIGQVGLGYDYNRNLLSDGSREFRYNYRNELRQAWRRSDGPNHGKISEYRHDALGREVSTRTWWELARRCYLDTRFELDIDTDFDGDGNKLKLVDGGMTSDQPAPIGQLGQRAAWSSRINRLSDRDAHYFDFLIDVPALAGSQHANYLLGVLAYEQAEVRIYPARYELVIGGTPIATHNVASTAGRHNLGICAKGALSGEVSGVWLDGAQIFNGVGLWTQSPPRALFTTQNADPTGLTQINGVVLLDFFAYIKSFLRTVDDSDLTMGSGTFGGIGSGNGVTPPAMPRATLCVPDGPAACSVYELALDGSGNTAGAPAIDEQGDSTRQTTWRPFLSEPATLLHVVNGSRDPAVTFAPGYGAEGGSVGPLAINVPDAVDESHWYVKPVASLPGHTPATSGGAGLPRAPLYVCSGFNRKHGTGDDRTTAPPDAYPLPMASAPGGGDPGSADGESKASTGPCACSLGNPSVANAASTTDEGTGATKSPAGHWTDPVPAVIYSGFLDISKLVHGADDDDEGLFSKWGRAIGGYVGDKIEEKVREIKAAPWLVIPGGAAVKYIGQPVAEEVAKAYKDPTRLIPFKAMKDDACEMVSKKAEQYEGVTTEEGRQKIVDELKNPTKETIHKIERIGVDVITVVGVAVAVVGAVRYIRVTLSNGTVAAYSEPAFAKSTAPDVGDVAGAKPKPASAAAPNAKAQQPAQSAATNSGGGSSGASTNGPTPTDRLKSQLFEREGKPKSASAVRAAQTELAGGPKVCGKDHVTKVRYAQRGLKNRIAEIQRKAWHPGTPPWERQALLRELSEASKLLDKTEEFVK